MRYSINLVILSAVFCVTSACSDRKNLSPMPTISDEAKQELSSPVNCNTAKQDLEILEGEKASTGKRILSGVRSVMPIAAVAGILMGDYRDRVQVAAGTYNDDLDKKINEIKSACSIR